MIGHCPFNGYSTMSSLLEPLRPLLERHGIDNLRDLNASRIWEKSRSFSMALWSNTTRRMRMVGAIVIFLWATLSPL